MLTSMRSSLAFAYESHEERIERMEHREPVREEEEGGESHEERIESVGLGALPVQDAHEELNLMRRELKDVRGKDGQDRGDEGGGESHEERIESNVLSGSSRRVEWESHEERIESLLASNSSLREARRESHEERIERELA